MHDERTTRRCDRCGEQHEDSLPREAEVIHQGTTALDGGLPFRWRCGGRMYPLDG